MPCCKKILNAQSKAPTNDRQFLTTQSREPGSHRTEPPTTLHNKQGLINILHPLLRQSISSPTLNLLDPVLHTLRAEEPGPGVTVYCNSWSYLLVAFCPNPRGPKNAYLGRSDFRICQFLPSCACGSSNIRCGRYRAGFRGDSRSCTACRSSTPTFI